MNQNLSSKRTMLLALALASVLLMSACGFHMRGSLSLPYDSIYIGGAMTQELRLNLERTIKNGSNVRLEKDPKKADLLLNLVETNGKQILSYNAAGQVTAYRLVTQARFHVDDKDGTEMIPDQEIFLTRDMDFSVTAPTAAESLEQLLVSDMRLDITGQVLRRFGVLQKKAVSTPTVPATPLVPAK